MATISVLIVIFFAVAIALHFVVQSDEKYTKRRVREDGPASKEDESKVLPSKILGRR
jgi:preprotein translocase subunit SecG